MTRVRIDVTDKIPTLDELRDYGVSGLQVVTAGPGSGNPELTLQFDTEPLARRFLAEWYGADAQEVEAGTFFLLQPQDQQDQAGGEQVQALI